MTTERFDRTVADMFSSVERPNAADLIADVLAATATVEQHRPIVARLFGVGDAARQTMRSPAIRFALLALLVLLAAVATVVVGSRLLDRRPFHSSDGIFVSFDAVPDRIDVAGADILGDGRVMFEGPQWDLNSLSGQNWTGWVVKIWDPATNQYRSFPRAVRPPQPPDTVPSSKAIERAIPLADGRILIVDGWDGPLGPVRTAELLDPTTGVFTPTGSLLAARSSAASVRLGDGRVLFAGGEPPEKDALPPNTVDGEPALASAELFDSASGTFVPTGSLRTARLSHAMVPLADGRVLVVGGMTGSAETSKALASAEIYDPATGTFAPTGSMLRPRGYFEVQPVLLADGRVLVIGGASDDLAAIYDEDAQVLREGPTSTELYDPRMGTFTTGPNVPARPTTAALLDDGAVLLTGTWSASHQGTVEIPFRPHFTDTHAWAALVDATAGIVREIAAPDGAATTTGGPSAHLVRLADGRMVYVEGWNANDRTNPEGMMAIFTMRPGS